MKSNVLLQSESRELLGRNISVMSKDGFCVYNRGYGCIVTEKSGYGVGA